MATFAGGTLRVTTPTSYDAQPARTRTDRGLPGDPGAATEASKDALVTALEDSDLALVERVDLTPRRTRDLGDKPASNRAGKVKLEVDVPPDEDAVVLLERDGVYSWHLPVNPAAAHEVHRPRPANGPLRDRRPAASAGPPDRPAPPAPGRADGTRTGACWATSCRARRRHWSSASSLRPSWRRPSRRWRRTSGRGSSISPTPTSPSGSGSRPWTSSTCRPTGRCGCCCSSTAPSPRRSAGSARWPSTRTGRASCAPPSRRTTPSSASTTRP